MASVKAALLFLALVALSACGRPAQPPSEAASQPDPAASQPAPRAVPPAPADSRPRIVVFGDSLRAGFGADPGQSFPDYLQKDLDQLGFRYRVVNLGVSGDTTSDGLTRLPGVAAEKPSIVILELGGNDGLRGIPISMTRDNLVHIIEGVRASGARILLAGITLPPNYGPDYIHPFELMYRDLAARYRLPMIPFLLQDVIAQNPPPMQADGIHPTAKGNQIVARTVLRKLQPMLRK